METPARQFVFEGLTMEERRQGKPIWSGTAKRADGDLSSAEMNDVSVTYPGPNGEVKILAPHAQLDFDAGEATFDEARIVDAQGGELFTGTAHYVQAEQRVLASGPLRFSAQGLTAHATSGVVRLDLGTAEIEGPVQGRFEPR